MKKRVYICFVFLAVVMGGCSYSSTEKEDPIVLTISAASSLQDVLKAISEEFQKKHTNIEIQYNFGASGSLAKQIEQGAPVDLFFSASSEKFNDLISKELIQESATFISNQLVLITAEDGELQLEKIEDLISDEVHKVSIGSPSIVPAGTYAKQSLDQLNLWPKIESKIVYAKDVRQVLTYVETGNVAAGFVYKTDAIVSENVKIITTVDEESHDLITYPVGILKNTGSLSEAKQFYDFLQSAEVKEIWIKYGFTYIQ
ncbi:molybdate ABC transporter substrate-binding protein [Lysinibacillus sp. SGAir0095]|uniref:molybdate ABC transporter substrate-binding protein n=1 Tax=Lysinibacillus sp. SGAir0095 TaxID=2070463 RepID=UPI0010CD045E|nr:molybdate ABC transporter substrate-binding protein [Lysinibacillus sp. SGAir0095]QCR32362.1 molybdate ABC transporter substrate-binding protein [Lysinibacillus sp. SGAir0095]